MIILFCPRVNSFGNAKESTLFLLEHHDSFCRDQFKGGSSHQKAIFDYLFCSIELEINICKLASFVCKRKCNIVLFVFEVDANSL